MKKRIPYFDILNVLSCFCVVCLHCNGYVHSFVKDDWWWLRVLVEVLCFFAVPVFFMLSGATLLDYREKYSTSTFVKKRFQRTFVPFLLWSTIFYSLYLGTHGAEDTTWREVITNLCAGKIPFTNYWFFIPLFFIYAFIPFFSLMKKNMTQRQIMYLCLFLGILQIVIPTTFQILGANYDINLPIGSYIIYVFLGYYLTYSSVEHNNIWLTIIGAAALLSVVCRYILIYSSNEEIPAMFSYFGLYAVLPATFVFMLFKRLFTNLRSHQHFWQALSSKSLGIYLIHTVLISMVGKIIGRDNIVFIPVSIVTVYLLSTCIVHLMQKNKLTNYLIP